TEAGRACLTSPAAPIVLAPFRPGGQKALAPAIAPGLGRLGVMLPSSPLHDVLVRACGGPLVMTSGNRSDEPLAWDDAEAVERLTGIADGFLVHDRPIVRAVDDSVLIDCREGPPLPLRRARGYVPDAFVLPRRPEGVGLCLGADLKSAVALVLEDGRTVLSEYLGDMSHPATYRRARATIGDLTKLFDVRPDWIAVDAHPGYVSHRLGRRIARELAGDEVGSLPVFEVQHHHAHLAALLAEHDRVDPIVGIAADGVGFGTDGSAWGGEILVVGPDRARRVGRLRPLRLPGGDAAARETVRCGLSWLVDTVGIDAARRHPASPNLVPDQRRLAALFDVLERDLRCPPSSGLGRLFDAAAAVLGVCRQNRYEAESGQLLEALAGRAKSPPDGTEILPLDGGGTPFEIDHRPLLFALLQGVADGYLVEDLAWFFHDAVADALARAGSRAARAEGLTTVGLSGGVFCNELLTHRVRSRLESRGVEVLTHRRVPPNDGGIALGQAAVVAAGGGSGLA
ncbi:MAG: Sua5/YciO/YrdC/YwlC family protein, partial [Gemmatimonadetes bacterium]|nr:Sua5/YciO/YrdC/YwlC family protein [Gemmatimonadota bacterium]